MLVLGTPNALFNDLCVQLRLYLYGVDKAIFKDLIQKLSQMLAISLAASFGEQCLLLLIFFKTSDRF